MDFYLLLPFCFKAVDTCRKTVSVWMVLPLRDRIGGKDIVALVTKSHALRISADINVKTICAFI